MVTAALSPSPGTIAALVPLLALVPAVTCMVDISRHPDTRRWPPQTWMVICLLGNVFGLVAYLLYGRSPRR
ncbi:PLDc N-terminal domain-containing protein [Kitasatospora sp. NPDC093679]|uniref:PLDc N-terminal domain-containing protein n=1 Tax=Kitasatospora sp. NPDC093679 TaxID=3154983 RepID=UPI00341502A4